MNRDEVPSGPAVALATGELMVAARRAVAALPPDTSPGAAAAAVRDAIMPMWPRVMPEAVRDVMASAAEMAYEASAAEQLGDVADDTTEGMLELTGEWIAAGRPAAAPGGFTPPLAFASSVAFDRDEDAETLSALSLLLALAHLSLPRPEVAEGTP